MTLREASAKVLVVLFGVKVPTRRPCVRVERFRVRRPAEQVGDRVAASLQGIREVCERNKRKAPQPVAHFAEREPGEDDDREEG